MKSISGHEFEKKFDNNEDVSDHLDFARAVRLEEFEKSIGKSLTVSVGFPEWIIKAVDREAKRTGVTREEIIRQWIAQKLELENHHA